MGDRFDFGVSKNGVLLDTVKNTPMHTYTETAIELVQQPSTELAQALGEVERRRRNTRASATETAYSADWDRFLGWAEVVELKKDDEDDVQLPLTPEIVCAHLLWLSKHKYQMSTIERFLAAVTHMHRRADVHFRRDAQVVADTMESIRRDIGVKQSKKTPLEIEMLETVCERMEKSATTLTGEPLRHNLRCRTLLAVGWFCLLRSANLVTIRRRDVRLVHIDEERIVEDEETPNGVIVHLPSSKTDQRKRGRDIGVHAQQNATVCPVKLLSEYLRGSTWRPDELIFPVSRKYVSRMIKLAAADPSHAHSVRSLAKCKSCAAIAKRFASHSLRRGAATTMARKGIGERELMEQGGWKTERVARGYIEQATPFKNNPTKGLA